MKSSILIAIFLMFSQASYAQFAKSACPDISVNGPAGVTTPGDSMAFSVEVKGGRNIGPLKYVWETERGVIVEGQGTTGITVRQFEAGSNVTARVSVSGLSAECTTTAAETAPVEQILCNLPIDMWGNLPLNEQRSRMDVFFVELESNPTSTGFVLLTEGGKDPMSSGRRRISQMIKHADFRKFDATRIIFEVCPSEETSTKLWRVPPGAEFPGDGSECRRFSRSEL
jgi:hypothetical protein